ncbi:Protein LHCP TRANSLOCATION DEFECT Protein GRANA-DEFICIENT CHLOROPLAST 1 Precursor [Vigna angularis]|uniref:Protein LHCP TRANSLOCATION DEFECT n=1 Tax=Phaseolus angularis TaxID=3914 RepID=A0A8T0K5D7_PHAAN|nr:Protein LHCP TRANSLOCATION DEFECT Protein GRANA-DEFICIENT CHLOROPLAST 1 Precursor [Vigna angularis]
MASISCITHHPATSKLKTFSPSPHAYASNLASRFLGTKKSVGWLSLTSSIGPSNGSRATCWFRFGKNGVDAEGAGIYGSQSRDDFDRDDVEQAMDLLDRPLTLSRLTFHGNFGNSVLEEKYFNYMGMLAVDGTYDKMEALLSLNIHPVDILLLLAASEGDKPKIEELLRAGAKYDVKDREGRTALDRANEEIKEFILNFSVQRA